MLEEEPTPKRLQEVVAHHMAETPDLSGVDLLLRASEARYRSIMRLRPATVPGSAPAAAPKHLFASLSS